MALQDLTPQLRTRLSRMERAVGWFVLFALGLLLFGFGYYIYNMAERKGWFLTKATYFTFVQSGIGLRVGDPVKLMGFDAGSITDIKPMPAEQFTYNVYIEFELKSPNYGYIWTEGSHAKITTADFLGKRVVEVTKGTNGYPTYIFHPLRTVALSEIPRLPGLTNWALAQELFDQEGTGVVAKVFQKISTLEGLANVGATRVLAMNTGEKNKSMTGIWNYQEAAYEPYTNKVSKYWLLPDETPAVTERLEEVVSSVQDALPGVFALTNQLAIVLSNTATLTSTLNEVARDARPAISNLTAATAQLDRPGALGEWLLPTNISSNLESTLANASATMASANTNVAMLAQKLAASLENLAGITSNLNSQVEANTNLVSGISRTIHDADQFIQGLKRHWLLRSTFKSKPTNAPPSTTSERLRSPKQSR